VLVRLWPIMSVRVLAFALITAGATIAGAAKAQTLTRSASQPVALNVQIDGLERSVPSSYLGFSVEWTELPAFEADIPAFARLLGRLSVAREPVPMRLGGETADNTYWAQPARKVPPNAYVVRRNYFTRLGQLARATPLSLVPDVNLAARSARMAQSLGRELRATVPTPSVTGFEIGNEPDLYPIGLVGNRFIKPGADSPFQWALRYRSSAYASDFARYVRALAAVWPHVYYAGPSQASGRTDYAHRTLRTGKLSMLTIHRYEFSACSGPDGPAYPSEKKYLSVAASRAFAARSQPFVAIAHTARIPVRVTEFGSAICGGRVGLTNTFATALWAADTIFDLMAQGLDGVNVHLRQGYPNSALNASRAGLTVNPLYYGMLLVTRTLGPGAQLLRVKTTPAAGNIAVWAVRDRRHVTRVLLLNESGRPARTDLIAGVSGHGTIQRLTAPAPSATTHIQFAGRSLTGTGGWTGASDTQPAPLTARGRFVISLPSYSAAILTITP
jgi:hypothetical protein